VPLKFNIEKDMNKNKFDKHKKNGTYHWGESGCKLSSTICVTGMHRSGTSLVAMWLNSCGIKFKKDQLIAAGKSNKKGHFEDKRLVKLHHLIVKDHVPRSKGWIVTKDVEFTFSKEHKDMARMIVMSYEPSYDIWGWKDPRMSLVLKSWKELIPDLKVIMVWRSADAVVHSLIKRSHGTSQKGVKLNLLEAIQSWKVYNKKILEFCSLFPNDTLLIPLHYLIKRDKEVIGSINSKFAVNLKNVPISELYKNHLLTSKESHYLDLYPGIRKITKQLEKISEYNYNL